MKVPKILICSPHLDDAALSCFDHIRGWKNKGYEVTVLSIFTSFKANRISVLARSFMTQSGFSSVEQMQKQREKEDRNVMRLLGVGYKWLGLVDGAFRSNNGKPLYEQNSQLFGGHIHPWDMPTKEKISGAVSALGVFDMVVSPLGVGGHVDHMIVRLALEGVCMEKVLRYFVDFPYATKLRNWKKKELMTFFLTKQSWKWISDKKQQAIALYTSQSPLLFAAPPRYPEVILSPK